MQESVSNEGIGASVPRLEDDRYMRGKGEFIADIRLAGMRDLAFVRSPVAHGRIRGIRKPAGRHRFSWRKTLSASSRSSPYPVCLGSRPQRSQYSRMTRYGTSAKQSPS